MGERQNKDNGRVAEADVRCNVKEKGRRLERDKNGKTGHQENVVERRRDEKRKERKTERL